MQASLSEDWIVKATRYRYSLPILAELQRDQGCKFITLVRRLDASDRAIRQALDYLIGLGWVERNPGYGHPSRPEYLVASSTSKIGSNCLGIWNELAKWNQWPVALERWPLAVLFAIGSGRNRYGTLLDDLPGLTPRALSLALARLARAGLAAREVLPGNPPQTDYRATPWGLTIIGLSRSPT